MLQAGPGRVGQKPFAHQALQLRGGIGHRLGGVFAVFEFAAGCGVFGQDGGGQAGHLVRDQGQAAPSLLHTPLKLRGVQWQRFSQKGTLQCHGNDLAFELFYGSQLHIGRAHGGHVRDVFFKVFHGLFDLQGKQPGEAPPVAQRGHVGFVKHFNSHAVLGQGTGFHQRRVTDQRLPALMDFKQFGQLAKRPLGVGLGGVDLRAARAILAIFRINFTCFYY